MKRPKPTASEMPVVQQKTNVCAYVRPRGLLRAKAVALHDEDEVKPLHVYEDALDAGPFETAWQREITYGQVIAANPKPADVEAPAWEGKPQQGRRHEAAVPTPRRSRDTTSQSMR